jgi:hypothetical protein
MQLPLLFATLLALCGGAQMESEDQDLFYRNLPWYQTGENANSIYPTTPSPFEELLAYIASLIKSATIDTGNAIGTSGLPMTLLPVTLPPLATTISAISGPLTLPNTMLSRIALQFGFHNQLNMQPGQSIPARQARQMPNNVHWPSNNNKYYALMMIHPNPSNTSCDFLHWLMINIKGDQMSTGQTLAQYVPPFPDANRPAGQQSYLVLVFEQPGYVVDKYTPFINCFTRNGRDYGQWSTSAFLMRNRLGTQPIAATYFYAECDQTVRDVKLQMGIFDWSVC